MLSLIKEILNKLQLLDRMSVLAQNPLLYYSSIFIPLAQANSGQK